MITAGISLIGYKRTGTYELNGAAAPKHFAKYASRMYKSASAPRNMGRSLNVWRECLKQGAKLYQLLKAQPWKAEERCDLTHIYSPAHVVTEWQRFGDFVAVRFELNWVVVDLRTAEVIMCYFNGARLHKCDPLEYADHQNKARQVAEGTWPVELPAGAHLNLPERKPTNYAARIGFGRTW